MESSVLVIHLGAMGAVLRSTALLSAIKRKYPRSQITWVTEAPMHHLLTGHPDIDRVVLNQPNELLVLRGRVFDAALVIDKSAAASGILAMTEAKQVFGFVADPQFGNIHPATSAATELFELGLSNHKKFFVNQKSECQLVHEALELGDYRRESYSFSLTQAEQKVAQARRLDWQVQSEQPIIGFNTGCGPLMPAKKWSVAFHREAITRLLFLGYQNIVLLGGPEDEERNQQIALGLPVATSPCRLGVRDGAISTAACDIVVTGDSFGMHLAIALQKFVVAWFGPSCIQEIDLFGRGVKLQANVPCSPCWKKSCDRAISNEPMCYDRISLGQIESALQVGLKDWQKLRTVLSSQSCELTPLSIS